MLKDTDSSTNTDLKHPQTGVQVNSNDIDMCMCTSSDQATCKSTQAVDQETCMPDIDAETDLDSSDYTDEYVMDSDDTEGMKRYEEEGVSLTYLHGVFYTPPGFKRVRVKRVHATASDDHESTNNENFTDGNSPSQVKKTLLEDFKNTK